MQTTEQTVLDIINIVLTNRSKPTIEHICESDNLRETIGLDSLDLAELTVRLEAQFGIDIFENGLISTVGEMLSLLK